MRGATSLLLEIPFFIAAYRFLSGLSILQGVSFGPIADLGKPDGLLHIAGLTINLLPIVMTVVNLISCVIFTKGSLAKTKIQLYGMAIFFLFFLYTSPSGLVFYWTLNNVFSLAKTAVYKLKYADIAVRIFCALAGIGSFVYGFCFYPYPSWRRLMMFALLGIALLAPLVIFAVKKAMQGKKTKMRTLPPPNKKLFFGAMAYLAAFTGLLISVVIYAIGGGLLEVIISPVMESCPTQNKEQHMSLLHSFYCWGHMGVVLLSTAFFALFGIGNWKLLALLWALVPVVNAVFFGGAPLYPMQAEGAQALSLRTLVKSRVFWLFMVMMLCAGASEQAVSQWSSAFAEQGLGVSKTVGDLAGPMAFAAMMGVSRLIFGKYGEKLNLNRYMAVCAALCVGAYLCIVFVPSPVLSLLGCAVCGFSVGIFWPGTFSRASASIRGGGTQMFALLALAGDLGCAGGPTLAGLVSDACGGALRAGILAAIIFPLLMLLCMLLVRKQRGA